MTKNDLNIVLCSGAYHFKRHIAELGHMNLIIPHKHTFPGNEISISVLQKVHNRKTIVIQSLIDANNDFMELCFTLDILRSMEMTDISLIIPYMAYSRQDKSTNIDYNAIHIETVAKFLNSFNLSKIILCDMHNTSTLKYFTNVINLVFSELFAAHILQTYDYRNLLIIAPDSGSISRAKNLANLLNCEYTNLTKKRYDEDIAVSFTSDPAIFGQRDLIILDDIVASGLTLHRAGEFLNTYNPKSINVYATHMFYPALSQYYLAKIDNLVYTNTVFERRVPTSSSYIIDITNKILQALDT